MTLSLSISDEIESKLRNQAAAAGKEVGAYASELLSAAVSQPHRASSIQSESDEGPSIGRLLAPALEKIWAVKPSAIRAEPKGDEAEARRIVIEKYRKQGLRL